MLDSQLRPYESECLGEILAAVVKNNPLRIIDTINFAIAVVIQ